jgi:hypothetical protein
MLREVLARKDPRMQLPSEEPLIEESPRGTGQSAAGEEGFGPRPVPVYREVIIKDGEFVRSTEDAASDRAAVG